jgi:hypothetical protein
VERGAAGSDPQGFCPAHGASPTCIALRSP